MAQTAQTASNFMQTLKFAAIKKVNQSLDQKVQSQRLRMIQALEQQKAMVLAKIDGKPYVAMGRRFITGQEGKRIEVEKEIRTTAWFFKSGEVWYVEMRYGSSPMQINKTGNAIIAGQGLPDVLKCLSTLSKAVESGELDALMADAAGKRGRKKKEEKPQA